MEYIEREAAITVIKDYGKGAINDGMKALDPVNDIIALAHAMEWILAADVAPVVRCKYCRKRKSYECPMYFANGDEDFCSYGEYQRNTFEGEK